MHYCDPQWGWQARLIGLPIIGPSDQDFEKFLHLQRRAIAFNRVYLLIGIIPLKVDNSGRYYRPFSSSDFFVNTVNGAGERTRQDFDGHFLMRMRMFICDGSVRRHLVAHLEELALGVACRLVKGDGLTRLRVSKGSCAHNIPQAKISVRIKFLEDKKVSRRNFGHDVPVTGDTVKAIQIWAARRFPAPADNGRVHYGS